MPSPAPLRSALTVLLAGFGLALAPGVPAYAVSDAKLVGKLDSVLEDSRAQRAKTGVVVLDAKTGDTLYSRQGSRSVLPASNMKVLTAVAALHTLGADYRFRTEVIRRDSVTGGTLAGPLYLKGYGDPTSRQRDYARLADQVRAAGITKVTGRLVVDAGFFDTQRYHPGWATSYASEYYAAPVSALTVAPNSDLDSGSVIIKYRPRGQGKKARLTTTPAAAKRYLKLVNKTTTSGSGSSTITAARSAGSDTITVRGRVPVGRSGGGLLVSVRRPDLYAGAVFRAELARAGVTVTGTTKAGAVPPDSRSTVAVDTSIKLSALLVPFLKLSNNAHAEALTKTMGTLTGQPGSWAEGLSRTTAYLEELGVPMAGVRLVDGSGLSRRTRLTPAALAAVLQRVQQEPWFSDFSAALPVAGNPDRMVGGTLGSRMTGTAAANNARAKTGSLTGVTSLSGYVRGADGNRYVFAVISNYTGSSPRPVENSLVIRLAGHRR